MFLMQSVSLNPLIAIFQLSSAASLNLGRSQNGVSFVSYRMENKVGKEENVVYIGYIFTLSHNIF